jgi:hypothetical protein
MTELSSAIAYPVSYLTEQIVKIDLKVFAVCGHQFELTPVSSSAP